MLTGEWNTSYTSNHTILTKFVVQQPSVGDSMFQEGINLTSVEKTYFKFDYQLNYGTVHEITLIPFAISDDLKTIFGEPLTSEIIVGYGNSLQLSQVSQTRSSITINVRFEGSCDYVIIHAGIAEPADRLNCPEAIEDFITISRLLPATSYNVSVQVNLKTVQQTIYQVMMTEFGTIRNVDQGILESGRIWVLIELEEPAENISFCLLNNIGQPVCSESFPTTPSATIFGADFAQADEGKSVKVTAMIGPFSGLVSEIKLMEFIHITKMELESIDNEKYLKEFELEFNKTANKVEFYMSYSHGYEKNVDCVWAGAGTMGGRCAVDVVVPGTTVNVTATPFYRSVKGFGKTESFRFEAEVDTLLIEGRNVVIETSETDGTPTMTVNISFVGHVTTLFVKLNTTDHQTEGLDDGGEK